MIIDQITNTQKYNGLNPGLEKAFHFLKTTDLENLDEGSYELDGDKVVAIVQGYKTVTSAPWEFHKHHIDIQYIISGQEKIGYHASKSMKLSKPYNVEFDYAHLEDVDGDYLTLKDGDFMLLFPEDGHVPRIAVDEPASVKKVVVKVVI